MGATRHGSNLQDFALLLSGWQTPTSPVNTDGHQAGNNRFVTSVVRAVSGWASPATTDHKGSSQIGQRRGQLSEHALMVGWATPTEGDAKSSGSRNLPGSAAHPGVSLTDMSMMGGSTRGRIQNGSTASTAPRGALNPAFARWLMGLPSGWDQAAPLKASRGSGC
jgi:hypothetical protein